MANRKLSASGYTMEEKCVYTKILETIPIFKSLVPAFEGHPIALEQFVELVSTYMQLM